MMLIYYYFGIVVLINILGCNGQRPCRTTSNTEGSCISIYDCSYILNLLRRSSFRPMRNTELETVRNSQCGFDGDVPMVCCSIREQATTAAPKNPGARMVPKVDTSVPAGLADPADTADPVAPAGPPDVTRHPNLKYFDQKICGPLTQSRVISGNKTTVAEYQWMALISYKIYGKGMAFKCGGTVINKRYVLTAAHCVTGLGSDIELVGVRLGEHDIAKEKDCDVVSGKEVFCADKHQDFLVEKVRVHSEFNKKKHQNDIALIRLNADADFERNNVKPICLPIGNFSTLAFKKGIVTGWGRTETGFRSSDLRQVRLEIVDNGECSEAYENQGIEISHKQLCAGGKDSRDSCAGDSGGPLQLSVLINEIPKFIQYGIVGFGTERCGVQGFPGVYTRVAYYMDWILDHIQE